MRRRINSILGVALVGALALTGCSVGEEAPGSDGDDAVRTVDTPIGEPEKTKLTIALSAPNLDSQAPIWIALDKGYYAEQGLEVEVISADDTVAGLVGGSLDLAVVDALDVVDAAVAGTGVKLVAGYRQRQPFIFAARNGIQKPSDLEGKQIILGDEIGTPIVDLRLELLKDAGFDLDGVGYTAVTPPGFSNAWVENFVQGQVEMTLLFPRHIPLIEAADGYLILDEMKEWPNDALAATEGWIEQNPNTLARFITATMKGVDFYLDLSNQQYVQDMMVTKDFTVTDVERDPAIYAYGPALYTAGMPLVEASFVDKMEGMGQDVVEFSVYTDTIDLQRALKALGR